jgi:hypothetical protein
MPTLDREAPVMAGRGFLCAEQTHRPRRAVLPGALQCRQTYARRLVLMIESFENFLDDRDAG